MKKAKSILKFTVAATIVACVFSVCISKVCVVKATENTTVQVEHYRTIEEILQKENELIHDGFEYTVTKYAEEPSLAAPYSAGSLDGHSLESALNAVKMVRYLAGVPYENIKFTEGLNSIAQHGAVLLASSDQFSHAPSKPEDMTDEFFDLGYRGCSEANISAGRSSISTSVLGFIYDSGQSNLARAGHRRWILKPGAENFGIGYAKGDGSYGGYRINMHVLDGAGPYECEADTYVAWPAAGAFPLQYFAANKNVNGIIAAPWSVNLGAQYKEPSKETVVVKLTRESDGKLWIFDKNTPNLGETEMTDDALHLAVDNGGYGMRKAIVFRPDLNSLGIIANGESFTVEITGIQNVNGEDTSLVYTIDFFDIEKIKNPPEQTVNITLPTFNVTLGGLSMNNTNAKYPLIVYNDITYFPMTYFDSRLLGLKTYYTPETGLIIDPLDEELTQYSREMQAEPNAESYTATVATGKITLNGKRIYNSVEQYPLLLFRDVTYFPLTWRFAVEEFGWNYSFDSTNGLVISRAE